MSNLPIGKEIPNLNVSIDPTRTETISTFVMDYAPEVEEKAESVVWNVQSVVPDPRFRKTTVDEGFATGIDLLSEENTEMLSKRAERFGLPVNNKETIKALYESLGITPENRMAGKMKYVRLDTIHVRGVEELNSDDIKQYFKEYGPREVEWINDCSCNVVFSDEGSCARALLGLSTSFPASFIAKVKRAHNVKDIKEEEKMDIDDLDVDIPVPPGNWRRGVEYPGANTLLLRFATTGDKKLPGAESRSKYYQKHGNPNYKGLTGIISNSMKKKQLAISNRYLYTNTLNKHSSVLSSSSEKQSQAKMNPRKVQSEIKIRPFMYADQEEKKVKIMRAKNNSIESKSVHSRLGKKYTMDELSSIGHASYSESDSSSVQTTSKNGKSDLREKLRHLRRAKRLSPEVIRRAERLSPEDYRRPKRSSPEDYRRPKRSSPEDYRRPKRASPEDYRRPKRAYPEDIRKYRSDYKEKPRKAYSRVEELKSQSKPSYFKRKYRSPLIEDDDDTSDFSDSS